MRYYSIFLKVPIVLFSFVSEKENLERIEDDDDSQAYHLEGEGAEDDDLDGDYASGDDHDHDNIVNDDSAVNDSAVNDSNESGYEGGELT